MPEVPENIQENLANLELQGNGDQYSDARHSIIASYADRDSSAPASRYPDTPMPRDYGTRQYTQDHPSIDQPSFSPFPKLHNPPPNVPPTDDQKEATLEQARMPVLNSNDPEMQLAWAQDALAYVEISIRYELRVSENTGPRPQTPRIEHQLKEDAISVVTFLAEQHHPKAEFLRGTWLEFGKFGFRMDKKEAFRSYSRAAGGGYPRAEYRMGMQFESSNEPEKAIRHYNRGVEAGDSASCYVSVAQAIPCMTREAAHHPSSGDFAKIEQRMGMMTLLGEHGQRQDYIRGVQLIRSAAQSADENAPQGAYVSFSAYGAAVPISVFLRCTACYKRENCRRSMCPRRSCR